VLAIRSNDDVLVKHRVGCASTDATAVDKLFIEVDLDEGSRGLHLLSLRACARPGRLKPVLLLLVIVTARGLCSRVEHYFFVCGKVCLWRARARILHALVRSIGEHALMILLICLHGGLRERQVDQVD
jgi:hypothetical protein